MDTVISKPESKITYSQAVLLARKAHSENRNAEYIAKALEDAGYISEATGKPVKPSGARSLALYGKARKHTVVKKVKAKPAPKTESVSKTERVSDRDALLVLILESNLKPDAKVKAALGCLHGKGV
jgi:copper chaperone CopZ